MNKVKKIILNHKSITLNQGEYYFWLNAEIVPPDKRSKICWLSENTEIALAEGQGNSCSVFGKSRGETKITVFSSEDESIVSFCKMKIK